VRMTGEQRIAASRQKVWDALNDPEVLRQAIPGCQSLEKEADGRLRATVEIKIGPIGARFAGVVSFSDVDAPNGYKISGEGQGGTVGSAKGGATVKLSDDAGGTLLSYEVDAQVGGRLAQLGGPIIDATAKQLAAKFFDRFGAVVTGTSTPAAKPASTAPVGSVPTVGVAAPAPASRGLPMAWILAVVVAALAGFLLGRGQGGGGSDYAGLAVGLLVVIVAAAGFEYGRRAAAPTLVLDADLLARLAEGAKR
jgi:carbon monoxide dehydrogenase subunit G